MKDVRASSPKVSDSRLAECSKESQGGACGTVTCRQ